MSDHHPIAKPDGEFSVVQFFPDGTHEWVRERCSVDEALKAAEHYTQNVSAHAGLTSRVTILDGGDSIVFEWRFGEGVVFPEVYEQQRRDYGK